MESEERAKSQRIVLPRVPALFEALNGPARDLFRQASPLFGILVIAIGCAGLLGWALDSPWLKSLSPGLATMKANTALSFLLTGLALTFWHLWNETSWTGKLVQALCLFVGGLGLLTLLEYILGWNPGLDQALVLDPETPLELFPGRMSPSTALCFFLTAWSLFLLQRGKARASQAVTLMLAIVALLASIGYLFAVQSLYEVFLYSSMALHTTVAFLLVTLGLLFAAPETGWMQVLTSDGSSGKAGRRLVPGAILVPLISGTIILAGRRAGYYDILFAFSIFVLSCIVLLTTLSLNNIRILHRAEEEREKILSALKAAEEKYRHIFENAMEGICQILPDGKMSLGNPALAKMLGYASPAELIASQTSVAEQLFEDPEHFPQLQELLENTQQLTGFEARLQTVDGNGLWAIINLQVIRKDSGAVQYYEGTLVEITARKFAEEESQRLEAQLLQAQKMESVGRLAGGIAHDFNNLLVPVMGYAELARELSSNEVLTTYLFEIQAAADRAARLTQQILAFSRQQVLEMQVVNFNHIVEQFESILSRLVRDDIELCSFLEPSLGLVQADPGKIEQLLMNLVINACDAMPLGGKLTIETANVHLDESYAAKHAHVEPGPYVLLAVSDTGSGMDFETQQKIFDPFFTTKAHGEGTGLGLAIVFGIVKQHQGNIWVYSEPGAGTTFKIYLPLSSEESQQEDTLPKTLPTIQGNQTILIAEDEELVRRLLCDALEAHGFKVLQSAHPQACLQLAAETQEPIHLLLTDVVMPGMNGKQLYQQLLESRPELRVLYMSGYTDNVIVHHSILESGVQFLQKPFAIQDLIQKLKHALV